MIVLKGPNIPDQEFIRYSNYKYPLSVVYVGNLYFISRESGKVYSIPHNLDGGWTQIESLQKMSFHDTDRIVSSALTVKKKYVC